MKTGIFLVIDKWKQVCWLQIGAGAKRKEDLSRITRIKQTKLKK